MLEPLTIILFLIGFVILVKGADILIKGASSIARFMGVNPWVIGLTIVGIGTSIPEFSISLLANLAGQSDISLGTILGSNTYNLLFILGITALITPLVLKKEWITRDLVVNALTIMVSLALARDGVTRLEGLILLALFIGWLYWVTKKTPKVDPSEKNGVQAFTIPVSLVMILFGIIGVYFGARWVVDGAVVFATYLGISSALVSLTAVAIGTSLPELTVSFRAALKGNTALAVGNIIGSNVFDFFGIIGINAIIRPIAVSGFLFTDGIVTFSAAALVFLVAIIGKKYVIRRKEGYILVFAYLTYFAFMLLRG